MPKLNQIIAVVSGKKSRGQKELTEVYKKLQKPTLFEGISRAYQPLDEEGETQPPEKKNVQYRVKGAIEEVRQSVVDLLDATATQDFANCDAKSDVIVDGATVLENIPVTALLFLEKQLNDMQTFAGQLPTLDPAESWHWDENADCYASEPAISNRTKKIPRSHVLYEATKEHPAQTEMYHEDVKVGEWRTIKYSSAVPAQERNEILSRIRKLTEAIKFAREQANQMEVNHVNIGSKVFDFVFGA